MKNLAIDSGSARIVDNFDLVVGTGVGGIIALLVGRLDLSISDALELYKALEGKLFPSRRIESEEESEPLDAERRTILRELFKGEKLKLGVEADHCKVRLSIPQLTRLNKANQVQIQLGRHPHEVHPHQRYPTPHPLHLPLAQPLHPIESRLVPARNCPRCNCHQPDFRSNQGDALWRRHPLSMRQPLKDRLG